MTTKHVFYKSCFVPSCKSSTKKTPNKIFIHVPEKVKSQWCRVVGREKVPLCKLYCCEDHFNLKEDILNYHVFSQCGGKKRIKPDVVPHLNLTSCNDNQETLYQASNPSTSKYCDQEPRQNIIYLKNLNSDIKLEKLDDQEVESTKIKCDEDQQLQEKAIQVDEVVEINEDKIDEKIVFEEVLIEENWMTDLNDDCNSKSNPLSECVDTQTECKLILPKYFTSQAKEYVLKKENYSMQNTPGVFLIDISSPTQNTLYAPNLCTTNGTLDSILIDNSSVKSLDNTNTIDTLDVFESATKNCIESDPFLFIGLFPSSLGVLAGISKISNIPLRDIYLTLKKFRLNHKNSTLAYNFGYSETQITKVFKSTVKIISPTLKKFISWSNKEIIRKKRNVSLRNKFSKIESIIHTFEIQIEKPINEFCEANTSKYLISINPSGTINFISQGYDNTTNDTFIVEDSGYLQHLCPETEVVANRDFKQLSAVLQTKNCKLVCPTNVQKEDQKQITSYCKQVQKVIEKIKEFEFVNSGIDNNYLDILNDIIVIVCALINLQESYT